ncbi:hypothetical protein IWQ57_000907, partial [Coemansia nantahalensis]
DTELEIWDHVRRGNFHRAAAGSHAAYARWRDGGDPLTPLAQFVLDKRRFRIECLYAGILAGLGACGAGSGRDTLAAVLPVFYAAFLGDQSPHLAAIYCGQGAQQRVAIDAILAASTAFHYLTSRCVWKARLCLSRMPPRLPPDLVAKIDAVWMLRRPRENFVDVETAGQIIADMLRAGVVPDRAAAETLVSSAVRCGRAAAVAVVYASESRLLGLERATLVSLAVLREAMSGPQPRIHYDVMGTLARAGDLDGAIAVASAMQSRLMFHVLASLWAAQHPDDTQGIDKIVRSALAALDCRFQHSTHHTAITSILRAGAVPHADSAAQKRKGLVQQALRLHRDMAPRLETPSAAAISQLMQAAFGQGMATAALWLYRDTERRREWCASPGRFEKDAIVATLAGFFARQRSMRAIAHLSDAVLWSGISRLPSFYAAVVCELAQPHDVRPSVDACLRSQEGGEADRRANQKHQYRVRAFLRRLQSAEGVLVSMRHNDIQTPARAYHAVMYAWAVLGQPQKVQWLFCMLQAKSPAGRQTQVSEITWGILMYAYMRAHRLNRVFGVLGRAQRWRRSHAGPAPAAPGAAGGPETTSHLVNMAMLALVERGNGRAALALLDKYLERTDTHGAHSGLSASPGDRITLGLITRILVENRRFEQALRVYDDTHSKYALPEAPSELTTMLGHCLRMGDISGVLGVVRRILRQGGTLSGDHWSNVIYQCAMQTNGGEAVVYLYEQWCQSLGIGGVAQVPAALVHNEMLAAVVREALRDRDRPGDAKTLAASIRAAKTLEREQADADTAAADTSGPRVPGRSRKLRLYRALLREIRRASMPMLRGKLTHNTRFVYDLYRDLDPRSPRVAELVREGDAHLQWLRAWHDHPDVCAALVR